MSGQVLVNNFCYNLNKEIDEENNNNTNKKNKNLINEQIRVKQVRLIDQDGEQVGIVDIKEALTQAQSADLDLVQISDKGDTPVCKIMNYGKFVYEQQKKQKENRANQKQIVVKEVRVSPTIDIGDYTTKLNQARKFLEKGNKVQFSLRFRGRMITHSEIGKQTLDRIIEDLGDSVIVEQPPKLEGRRMFLVVSPNTKKA